MKTKRYLTFTVMITVVSFMVPVVADLSFYTDRSAWESAVSGAIVIEDFDSVTPSFLTEGINDADLIKIEMVNLSEVNQWNSIDNGSGYSNVNGTPYYQGACRYTDPDTIIVLHLPFLTKAFGGDFESTYSSDLDGLTLQVNGSRYEFSDLMSSSGGTGFLGFISTTDTFLSVTLFDYDEILGESFGLDNVSFAVPEPTTMVLLGLGGLMLRKRRKV